MYRLMVIISLVVRNFCLPNPFSSLEHGQIINWAIEPLIHIITFKVVGLFYQRGSAPAWGSFLYLLFYFVHTCLIMLSSTFNFSLVAIAIILTLYIMILLVSIKIKNRLN